MREHRGDLIYDGNRRGAVFRSAAPTGMAPSDCGQVAPRTRLIALGHGCAVSQPGVLTWGALAPMAVQLGVIIEEAAILAGAIGGANGVPHHLLRASLERHAHFEAAGASKAG